MAGYFNQTYDYNIAMGYAAGYGITGKIVTDNVTSIGATLQNIVGMILLQLDSNDNY